MLFFVLVEIETNPIPFRLFEWSGVVRVLLYVNERWLTRQQRLRAIKLGGGFCWFSPAAFSVERNELRNIDYANQAIHSLAEKEIFILHS